MKKRSRSRRTNNPEPVPADDYRRIHEAIYSVLRFEGREIETANWEFAFMAGKILTHFYELPANPRAGLGVYQVGPGDQRIVLGTPAGEAADSEEEAVDYTSTMDGFDAIVRLDSWDLNFFAPNFPALLELGNAPFGCPRKMFQKQRFESANDPEDLRYPGDYLFFENPELSEELAQRFQAEEKNPDTAMHALLDSYIKPPHTMSIKWKGEVIPLSSRPISGHW